MDYMGGGDLTRRAKVTNRQAVRRQEKRLDRRS